MSQSIIQAAPIKKSRSKTLRALKQRQPNKIYGDHINIKSLPRSDIPCPSCTSSYLYFPSNANPTKPTNHHQARSFPRIKAKRAADKNGPSGSAPVYTRPLGPALHKILTSLPNDKVRSSQQNHKRRRVTRSDCANHDPTTISTL